MYKAITSVSKIMYDNIHYRLFRVEYKRSVITLKDYIMDYKNKHVEKFFLEILPENEDITLSQCSMFLTNYYMEAEGVAFHSENYIDQDERLEAMFPGMPEGALNLCKYKAYKHRADHHGDKGYEKRTEDLDVMVSATVYSEYQTRRWWEN